MDLIIAFYLALYLSTASTKHDSPLRLRCMDVYANNKKKQIFENIMETFLFRKKAELTNYMHCLNILCVKCVDNY